MHCLAHPPHQQTCCPTSTYPQLLAKPPQNDLPNQIDNKISTHGQTENEIPPLTQIEKKHDVSRSPLLRKGGIQDKLNNARSLLKCARIRNPCTHAHNSQQNTDNAQINTDQNRSYVNNKKTYKKTTSTQKTTIDLQTLRTTQQENPRSTNCIQTNNTPPSHHEDLPNHSQRKTQISRRGPENFYTWKRKNNPKTTKQQSTNTTLPTEQEEILPTRPATHTQPQSILPTTRTQRSTLKPGSPVPRLHGPTRPHSQTSPWTTPTHGNRSTTTPSTTTSPDRPLTLKQTSWNPRSFALLQRRMALGFHKIMEVIRALNIELPHHNEPPVIHVQT